MKRLVPYVLAIQHRSSRVVPYYTACSVHTSTRQQNVNRKRAMAAADRLDDALDFAAKKLGISHFKSHQSSAIRQFVKGHDLFVNLPTGFG